MANWSQGLLGMVGGLSKAAADYGAYSLKANHEKELEAAKQLREEHMLELRSKYEEKAADRKLNSDFKIVGADGIPRYGTGADVREAMSAEEAGVASRAEALNKVREQRATEAGSRYAVTKADIDAMEGLSQEEKDAMWQAHQGARAEDEAEARKPKADDAKGLLSSGPRVVNVKENADSAKLAMKELEMMTKNELATYKLELQRQQMDSEKQRQKELIDLKLKQLEIYERKVSSGGSKKDDDNSLIKPKDVLTAMAQLDKQAAEGTALTPEQKRRYEDLTSILHPETAQPDITADLRSALDSSLYPSKRVHQPKGRGTGVVGNAINIRVK